MNFFFLYRWLVYILVCTRSIYGRSTGAPESTCGTMTPSHYGSSSQACGTNYMIQADKAQYGLGETVRITVNGSSSSNTFKGILLVAKTEGVDLIIGSWSVTGSMFKTLNCVGAAASTGVTHTSDADKTSIEAIWYPPSSLPTERTIIRATIVQTYSTFYVNCFNVVLTSREGTQATNTTTQTTAAGGTTTTTVATTTTTVRATDKVGIDVSWTYNNGVTTVIMEVDNLQTSQWSAVGLSLDEKMGEDHVFVCKRLANDRVEAERRINPDRYSAPQIPSSASNVGGTFTVMSQSLQDGKAYCRFTLSNFTTSGKRERRAISSLSQSTAYYPLIAIGNLDSSNTIRKHIQRSALSQQVQLNRRENIVYNLDSSDSNRTNLMKAHGILMIFAWILFASTGILIARHFKPAWPESKLCGKPLWFAIHRVVMISVVVLTIIAFILILVYAKGKWVPQSERRAFAHSIIGILIISFAFIQPIMAIFRCKPDAEYRFIFNYAHASVGLSAFILSIIALFLAMFFYRSNSPDNAGWGILIGWICWIVVIFIAFWFVEYYFRKQQANEEQPNSYNLDNSTPKPEPVIATHQPEHDRIRLALLILHILVALALSIALASRVGLA